VPALVETIEVLEREPGDLHSFLLERPVAGAGEATYTVEIAGWALGRRQPAAAIEVVHDEVVVRRIALEVERPDVAAANPDVPHALLSGFRLPISALNLPQTFELSIRVVLGDDSSHEVARLRGRRARLRSTFEPRLQPLMITTTGRTGSTALVQLLGAHPQVLAYRPFAYEPRVTGYWLKVLTALSEPVSYIRQVFWPGPRETWWLGRDAPVPPPLADQPVQEWMGSANVEAIAGFCQSRIEAFYEQIAGHIERERPMYFTERYPPRSLVPALVSEIYPQARELVLVRDFRDVVSSMLAFNEKRGVKGFGRDRADSDEEFILRGMGRSVAALVRCWEERSGSAHLVRYEDMVLRPEETSKAVLRYLGLESARETIEAMVGSLDARMDETAGHRTSPAPEASIGRWRQDLSPALQELCVEAFHPALEALGYSTEGDRAEGRTRA
jgi:hypothetical protein